MSKSISHQGVTRYPSLHGRAVFVTGGGSGIGAAIVEAFAAQGARVAFIDVAEEASRALAERIAAAGHAQPWWRRCDVRDVAALQSAMADAAGVLGDFHALVNNVASDDRHTLESITPAYYDERIAINQRAGAVRHAVGRAGHEAPGRRLHRQPRLDRLADQVGRLPLLRHRQVGGERADARQRRSARAATASASTP